jgi:hypothetical protein
MKLVYVGLFALAIIVLVTWQIYANRSRSGKTPASTRRRDDISGLSISLEIDNKRSLFILLAADGSINRLGTGSLDNTENGLFMGVTDPAIFRSVRSHLSSEMLALLGRTYEMPDRMGASCKLTIAFQFNDKSSDGLVIVYGAESEGPPVEVADFARAAVRQTDPWYENFKRATARRN